MNSTRVPVTVVITVGEDAEVVTPTRGPKDPIRVRAADISRDTGVPVGELSGYRLTAVLEGQTLRDFRLVEAPDPRD